jgi:phosphoribosylanthranilate isomerase
MKLTMTGVDERTSADFINDICDRYSHYSRDRIEFAILRSPKVGQSPRYPTREAIKRITDGVYQRRLAFHLCGRYAEMVFANEWQELCDIIDFNLVSRVQVNSQKADAEAILMLQRFSAAIGKPVIMQWRGPFIPFIKDVHVLQDRSGGTGKFDGLWSKPETLARNAGQYFGYAGGLTPDNVADAIANMKASAGGLNFWIDCESGIRTDDNWLDRAKCEAMAAAVFGQAI